MITYKQTEKLINNIIENEFQHISEHEEYEDFKADETFNGLTNKVHEALEKLSKAIPSHQKLFEEYLEAASEYEREYIRYYFKKGVVSGTSNLNFLRDITNGIKF